MEKHRGNARHGSNIFLYLLAQPTPYGTEELLRWALPEFLMQILQKIINHDCFKPLSSGLLGYPKIDNLNEVRRDKGMNTTFDLSAQNKISSWMRIPGVFTYLGLSQPFKVTSKENSSYETLLGREKCQKCQYSWGKDVGPGVGPGPVESRFTPDQSD